MRRPGRVDPDALLDPGEYWVFVSGFNAEARGAYSLSVLPLPM